MGIDERYVAGVDYEEDQACGEGMCRCSCDSGHVCGCDCWRCDECRQGEENCDCED